MSNSIETFAGAEAQIEPTEAFRKSSRISSREQYERLYRESLDSPETFWKRELSDLVFRTPWSKLLEWKSPHAQWFKGATLNITESCLDRHLSTKTRDQTAILW